MLPRQRPDDERPVADAFRAVEMDVAVEVSVFFGNGVGHCELVTINGNPKLLEVAEIGKWQLFCNSSPMVIVIHHFD